MSLIKLNGVVETMQKAEKKHIIDWDNAKIDKDSQKQTRWIREAIWIRKRGDQVINCDDGTYSLNHLYDQFLEHHQQPVAGKSGNTSKSGTDVSSQN